MGKLTFCLFLKSGILPIGYYAFLSIKYCPLGELRRLQGV